MTPTPHTPHASPSPLRSLLAMAALLLVATLAGSACGPTYPECDTDEHCASHNQVCVDNLCRDCRTDAQCGHLGPCGVCTAGYVCERKDGCCTSDLDCPGGRCWTAAGEDAGTCGGQCMDASHCPAGQTCSGGQCVPDVQCRGDADCGAGERCEAGQCVAASCTLDVIRFDFNESTIRLDMEDVLTANAECLKAKAVAHQVQGHCDERGSDEYNLQLGQRRAAAVKRAYERLGVPASQLGTLSYGEERPNCTQSSDQCWSDNRRAETVAR